MSKIFLVAHHPIFRAALAQVIEDQCPNSLYVVGESDWMQASLATIAVVEPDVVVVVVGLKIDNELASVDTIRALAPACRVLVIDTLGALGEYRTGSWAEADVLLHPEHLVAELTPAILGLAICSHQTPAPRADEKRRTTQEPLAR